MILDVYLYDELIGYLYTDKKYGLSFKYAEDSNRQISISMPVGTEEFRKKTVEPFFSGLLPDGDLREQLARSVHVSPNSVIGLLEHYGREIAGALVIVGHDEKYEIERNDYKLVSKSEIAQRIKNASEENLLIWGDNIRLSLAGAQHKMPLYHKGEEWYVPCGNSPSNCIVKPGKSVAINEFVVTLLAKECGFNVPKVELLKFEDELAFITYRYDRTIENGYLKRLHQEDMCQALSVPPEKKYETDGGPGISRIVRLIEDNSSLPVIDIREFYRIIVFNFIVGNCDSHGKNYSFLYGRDGSIRLAPFYDLVSTTIYPGISRELSMKIGKQKNIDLVLRDNFYKIEGSNKRAMDSIITDVVSSYKKAVDKIAEIDEMKPYCDMLEKIRDDSESRLEHLEE